MVSILIEIPGEGRGLTFPTPCTGLIIDCVPTEEGEETF